MSSLSEEEADAAKKLSLDWLEYQDAIDELNICELHTARARKRQMVAADVMLKTEAK